MKEVNFFNSGLVSVMRWDDRLLKNLCHTLTLDSEVLFYSQNENGFNLTECYTIKAAGPFSRKVGTWDRIDGLVIPEPNIWERRSNLGGTAIKICVMGNTFLMKANIFEGIKNRAFCYFDERL